MMAKRTSLVPPRSLTQIDLTQLYLSEHAMGSAASTSGTCQTNGRPPPRRGRSFGRLTDRPCDGEEHRHPAPTVMIRPDQNLSVVRMSRAGRSSQQSSVAGTLCTGKKGKFGIHVFYRCCRHTTVKLMTLCIILMQNGSRTQN